MRSRARALQLLGIPALFFAWLYVQQDSIVYHPMRYRHALPARLAKDGVELRELGFRIQDGDQSAILYKPVVGAPSRRLFAVFGGNAMVARNWIEVLAEFSDPRWKETAFLLLDYPGYGNSSGSPSQESIGRMSSAALLEAVRALSLEGRPDAEYGALGHSIGCAAALQLALAVKDGPLALNRVALSAPFTSIAEEAQAMLPFLRAIPTPVIAMLTAQNAWDNKAAARLLAGPRAPRVDIIHGTADEIVPHSMGEELSAVLTGVGVDAKFHSLRGADHNGLLFQKSYGSWLRRVITPSASASL